ncbi:MAG: hypothetical protein AB7E47_02205 [Desulfovibrionaceae bacterium]
MKRKALFEAMEIVEWDGKSALHLYGTDRFFFDYEEIEEYCADHDISPTELHLVLCEPVYAGHLDGEDFWQDAMPEDGELPEELAAAVDKVNTVIDSLGPLSWRPGRKRVLLPPF